MKKYISIFLSGILSGICIACGVCVFLMLMPTSKILGASFFGLGLFAIIHFSLWLYTGKIGFVLENKPKYLLECFACIVGNFIGAMFISLVLKQTRNSSLLIEQATVLVNMKQSDTPLSIFILSCMCGVMIYLAVKGHACCPYSLGKVIFAFLPIVVFIICGFEHCVANVSYYTLAGVFNWKVVGYFAIMIVGNAVGSILFDGFLKLIPYVMAKNNQTSKAKPNQADVKTIIDNKTAN